MSVQKQTNTFNLDLQYSYLHVIINHVILFFSQERCGVPEKKQKNSHPTDHTKQQQQQ